MVIKRLPDGTVIGYFERGDLFACETMGYDVSDGASVDLGDLMLAHKTMRTFFCVAAELEGTLNARTQG